MSLSSVEYLLFLAAVVALCRTVPRRVHDLLLAGLYAERIAGAATP